MNNPVSDYLVKSGNYSQHELFLMEQELQPRTLDKGELILNKGDICDFICFIIEGAVYQYKIDTDLNEIIIDLNISNEWVINHKSFTSQKPSEYVIKAFEKTSLYMLSIDAIHRLIAKSQTFLQMGKILDESTSRINFFDNNLNPDEKYQHILNNKPALLQNFPQTLIASYLKITPETLSRVRNRVAKS